MMRKEKPAESPDAYVAVLDGWRRQNRRPLNEIIPLVVAI